MGWPKSRRGGPVKRSGARSHLFFSVEKKEVRYQWYIILILILIIHKSSAIIAIFSWLRNLDISVLTLRGGTRFASGLETNSYNLTLKLTILIISGRKEVCSRILKKSKFLVKIFISHSYHSLNKVGILLTWIVQKLLINLILITILHRKNHWNWIIHDCFLGWFMKWINGKLVCV